MTASMPDGGFYLLFFAEFITFICSCHEGRILCWQVKDRNLRQFKWVSPGVSKLSAGMLHAVGDPFSCVRSSGD